MNPFGGVTSLGEGQLNPKLEKARRIVIIYTVYIQTIVLIYVMAFLLFSSEYTEVYPDLYTPDEDWQVQWEKCENNSKDEDNRPNLYCVNINRKETFPRIGSAQFTDIKRNGSCGES